MVPRGSVVSRLPLEIFIMVALILDVKSLITATHVCRHWRSVLLSYPCVWSHLTFENNQCTLTFLERSKSLPVSVDIDRTKGGLSEEAGETLKGVANRLTALRSEVHIPFLDELLTQPLPILKSLDVIMPRSVRSFATNNLGHSPFPRLTNLSFRTGQHLTVVPRMGDILLDFLQNSPLLEIVFFEFADIEFTIDEESREALSLSHLRSFTHESPIAKIDSGLFNRLSLPPTCDVAFTITCSTGEANDPWDRGFPTLCGLSDVKRIEIAVHTRKDLYTIVQAKFFNSGNTSITLGRLSMAVNNPSSARGVNRVLDFLGSCKMASSVEDLHFEHCPVSPPEGNPGLDLTGPLLKLNRLQTLVLWECNPEFFLRNPSPSEVWCPTVKNLVLFLPLSKNPRELLELVEGIAASRRESGNALESISLVFRTEDETVLQTSGMMGKLRRCGNHVIEHLKGGGGRSVFNLIPLFVGN